MTTRIFRLFLLIALLQSVLTAPPPTEDKEITDQRKQFSTFEVKPNPELQKDDVQKRPVRDSPPTMDHDMQSEDPMTHHEHHVNEEQKPAVLPVNTQNDPPRNNRDTISTTEKHVEMTTSTDSKESEESEEDSSSEEKGHPTNQKRESLPQETVHHEMGHQNDQPHQEQKGTDDLKIQDPKLNHMDETRKTRETEEKPQGDQPKPSTLPAYQRPQTLPAKVEPARKTRETQPEVPQKDQPKAESLPVFQRPQTLPAKLDENRKTRETEQKLQGDKPKLATLPAPQTPQTLPAKLDDPRKTRETEAKPQADQPAPSTTLLHQNDHYTADNQKPPLDVNRQSENQKRETDQEKPQNDQSKPIPEPIYPQLTYPAPVDKTRKSRETEKTPESGVGRVVLQKDDTLLKKTLQAGQVDGKVSEQKREVEKEDKHDMEGVQNEQSKDYHQKEIQVQEEPMKGQKQKRETTYPQTNVPSRQNDQPNPQRQPVGPVSPEVLENSSPKRPERENDPKDLEQHPQASHDFLTPPMDDQEHESHYPNYSPPSQRNSNVPRGSVYRSANEYKNPSDI